MATSYQYTLSGDFSGGIDPKQLENEVNDDGGIAPVCTHINTDADADTADIHFDAALSAPEKTTLDGIVAAHVPITRPNYSFIIPVYERDELLDLDIATSYDLISEFIYEGSNFIGEIQKIEVISNKDSTITSYDIKIFDATNSQTIVDNNFTNDAIQINELTPLSNLPRNKSRLEIQLRKNGGLGFGLDNCHLRNVIVYI